MASSDEQVDEDEVKTFKSLGLCDKLVEAVAKLNWANPTHIQVEEIPMPLKSVLGLIHLVPSKKRKIQILKDVSGIVRPSRMTLVLGPPSAGKTTLLLALAGKLDEDLRVMLYKDLYTR